MVWDFRGLWFREIWGHAHNVTNKPRGAFDCRKDRRYRMRKRFGCSCLVWWHVGRTCQLLSIKSNLGLMKNTFSSWSDEIPKIILPTFVRPDLIHQSGIRLTFESSPRTRPKNIRKCPAKSNPHVRITPPFLRKETRKTTYERPNNKTRERVFIQVYNIVHGLEKVK